MTTTRLRGWAAYLSHRMWILCVLLVILSVLAVMQYRWIDQVAEAQRQREKANLTRALSELESDFDIEITRAFVAFQVPFVKPDYAERYKEWLRDAPYPNLIRGVYIAEAGRPNSFPKPAIQGEPAILSTDWERDLPELRSPQFARVAVSAPASSSFAGLQTFSQGAAGVAFASRNPEVMIDGNPAFVFPIMPAGPGVTTRLATRAPGTERHLRGAGTLSIAGPVALPQWAVVVLDAEYIRKTFLPRLVNLYFRNGSASDHEVLVVNRNGAASPGVVFPAESAPPESQFVHPDGRIRLFELRLDCFSPASSADAIRVVGTAPNVRVVSGDSLSETLARKPATCSSPAQVSGNDAQGLWEMLVRYRAGSLDQAIATFRRRNLILAGSVLVVLALGISLLVGLTERARALAEMQAEFVLSMSHELRTPLTVIRLAADNLKKGMVENTEQARKYGNIINTHVSELSNMIEETLAFARMQFSSLIGHRTLVAPEQIVKEALANNESALLNADIEVELDLAPDLPLVSADIRLVKKCVENLIQNVIKYAAVGQWMAIRAKKESRAEGEKVQICVEDRGPGISAVDLPHIFEPFYRGKHGGACEVPGVGLGLTMVKRVVEAHQGAVEAESAKITRFSVFLPAYPVRQEAKKGTVNQ